MEKGSDYRHPFPHIGLCDESRAHPRGEYSHIVLLLSQHLYQDGIAHGLLSARSWGGRNTVCAVCESVGEETPVLAGNLHLDRHQHMGGPHGRV